MSRSRSTVRLIVLAVAALALTTSAAGQTWDGGGVAGGSVNWSNGINWVGDVAPVNNGTANIIMAGTIDTANTVDVNFDINGLTFNNTAGPFVISGQQLTIHGGAITNNDADSQTINSSIVLAATQTWNANSGNLVVNGNISPSGAFDIFVIGASNTTLSGIISGTIGFNKFNGGAGTLTLSGTASNTYSRDTQVNAGTVVLSKTAGINAIPGGTVFVGDGVGAANDDVLRLGASNQIANAANMVVNSTGLFDLNGFSETINGTLTLQGGNITTGAGTFTQGGDVTVNASTTAASISGNLGLSGQRTFTVADGAAATDLDIPATITSGGIIKAGAGRTRLGASNTLPSNVRIDAGTVEITNNGAFGSGTIQFNGGVITSNVINQTIANNFVIAGNVGFGTPTETSQALIINGNITLSGGDRTITFADAGFGTVFNGSIGQDVVGRSLTIDGTNAVAFGGSSANTYTGTTTVISGHLTLEKSGAGNGAILGNLVIGDGSGTDSVLIQGAEQINNSSTVTINSLGQLNLTAALGNTETINNLVMTRGSVSPGSGSTLVVTGGVTTNAGTGASTINGSGSLSLNGSSVAFDVADGTPSVDLDIAAAIINGSVVKTGPGTMRYSGNSSTNNTYSGTTTVNAGTLALQKLSGTALTGPLVIGDGVGGAGSDVVRWLENNQNASLTPPVVNASGLMDLNGFSDNFFGITLNGGSVTTGTGTLSLQGPVTSNANAQTASISGKISTSPLDFEVADGAAAIDLDVSATLLATFSGIVKNGAGTLRLSGTSAYTTGSTLNAGVVDVSADANLGATASGITFNGGTLRTSAPFSISHAVAIQSGGGTIETLGQTTLTGPISGTGALTKTGTATLIVSSVGELVGSINVIAGGVELADSATMNVAGATTVNSGTRFVLDDSSHLTTGSITNSGEIALNGASATLESGTLTNSGVVHGRGRIDAVLSNQATGEVRAISGELVQFVKAAASTNGGRINLLGGTVEFTQSALTNSATGLIVGNGTLDANSITNSGTMALSGLANLLGSVTNNSGAKIISSGGGPTTFFDDVVNNGEIRTSAGGFTVFFGSVSGTGTFTGTGTVNAEGDLSPGASPAIVNFAGNLGLGSLSRLDIELGGTMAGTQYDKVIVAGQIAIDGTLAVSLAGGFNPAAGNSFDILDWGTLSGTFASLQLPALAGGLTWNTTQLYTIGVLSVASAGIPGDFNSNGVVDAADYVAWRKGLGTIYTQDDYDVWRAGFGAQAPGSGAVASATVPEPTSLLLISVAAIGLTVRRRKRLHGR